MAEPALFAVDENERLPRGVERELADRYSRSCRIVCVPSAGAAVARLQALKGAGEDGTADEIFEAMGRRHVEYYVRPSQTPDAIFTRDALERF